MTAWEAYLAGTRKGKPLLRALQGKGALTDRDAAEMDLLDLMQKEGLLLTRADGRLFQGLEDVLMSVWRDGKWILQAGDRTYAAPSPSRALQRMLMDLAAVFPGEVLPLLDGICPWTGERLTAPQNDSLAGPSEGIRIRRSMRPGDAFACAEWLCRACGTHASLSFEGSAQKRPLEETEQLCMPGLDALEEHVTPEGDEEDEPERDERRVLTSAVQLGIPLFSDGREENCWEEVPIEASLTEETDTVTAGELADLLLGQGDAAVPEVTGPVQGMQLSLFDLM